MPNTLNAHASACYQEYGDVMTHKRIGILGGMSPESTIEYYQYITRSYTSRFGDYAYPEILIICWL